MKKQKVVKVPQKTVVRKATTKKVTTFTCDVCLKSVDKSNDNHYGSGLSECSSCGRDICRRDTKGGNGWPKTCYDDHPDDHGDYPRKMCVICLPLYRELYLPLQDKHWAEEEAMEKRIKKESLAISKPKAV